MAPNHYAYPSAVSPSTVVAVVNLYFGCSTNIINKKFNSGGSCYIQNIVLLDMTDVPVGFISMMKGSASGNSCSDHQRIDTAIYSAWDYLWKLKLTIALRLIYSALQP